MAIHAMKVEDFHNKIVSPVRLEAPKSIQPDFRIRKTRAYALLRLLTHPRFTHLEVGC